jgi:hypothetical protein
LVNVSEHAVEATFTTMVDARWSECDLMEAESAALTAGEDGKIALRFGRFEIKTVRMLV